MEPTLTMLYAIIAAMVYAGTFWVKKKASESPESFDWVKFGITIAFGAMIGLVMYLQNQVITEAGIWDQITTYFALIVFLQTNLMTLYKQIFEKKKIEEKRLALEQVKKSVG
jgi:drug/metabolite transporter (DMT)-like permease